MATVHPVHRMLMTLRQPRFSPTSKRIASNPGSFFRSPAIPADKPGAGLPNPFRWYSNASISPSLTPSLYHGSEKRFSATGCCWAYKVFLQRAANRRTLLGLGRFRRGVARFRSDRSRIPDEEERP